MRSATVTSEEEMYVVRFDRDCSLKLFSTMPKTREALSRVGLQRTEENLESMMKPDDEGVPSAKT